MAERLGKISSNVREMLIKMLSNIKKASVELFISEDGVSIHLALVSTYYSKHLGEKKNFVDSSISYALSKSRLKFYATAPRESRVAVADHVHTGA